MTSNSSLYGTPPNQDVSSTNSTSLYGGADTPIPTSDGNIVVRGDLIVLSGNILTTATTGNIFPENATTINIGGAATAVNIGANTGETTVNNDLCIVGDTLTLNCNAAAPASALIQVERGPGNTPAEFAWNEDYPVPPGSDPNGRWVSNCGITATGGTFGYVDIGPNNADALITTYPGSGEDLILDSDTDTVRLSANLTTNRTSINVLNTNATTVNAFGAATSLNLGASTGTTTVGNNLTVDGSNINLAQETTIGYDENNDRLNRPNFQSTTGNTSGVRVIAPNATTSAGSTVSAFSTNDLDNGKFININARGNLTTPFRIQTGEYVSGVLGSSGDSLAFVDGNTTYATVNPAGPTDPTDLTTKAYVDSIPNVSYTIDASTTTGGANFNLRGSDASVDTIKFASGTGVTVTRTDANTITTAIGQSVATTANPTFAGATLGNIKVGVTTDNTIDTSSGNLTIAPATGIITVSGPTTVQFAEGGDRAKRLQFQSSSGNVTGVRTLAPNATSNAVSQIGAFSSNDINNGYFINLRANNSGTDQLRIQTGQYISGTLNSTGGVAFFDNAATYATVNPSGPTNSLDLITKDYFDTHTGGTTSQLVNGTYTFTLDSSGILSSTTNDPVTIVSNSSVSGVNSTFTLDPIGTMTYVSNQDVGGGGSTLSVGPSSLSWVKDSASLVFPAVPAGTWSLNYDNTTSFPNFTFPAADGTSNQVLRTNGSGVLSWYSPSDLNTTYDFNATSTTGGANLNLVGSDSTTDTVKLTNGGGITATYTSGTEVTLGSTATDANTAGAIVARDGSGNFSAGTITANLANNTRVFGQEIVSRSTTWTPPTSVLSTIDGTNSLAIGSSGGGNGYSPNLAITYYSGDTTSGTNSSSSTIMRGAGGTNSSPSAIALNQVAGTVNLDGYATSGWAQAIATAGSGGGTTSITPLQIQGYAREAFADSAGTVTNAGMGFRVRGFPTGVSMSVANRVNYIDHSPNSATYRSDTFTFQQGTTTTSTTNFRSNTWNIQNSAGTTTYANFAAGGSTIGGVDSPSTFTRVRGASAGSSPSLSLRNSNTVAATPATGDGTTFRMQTAGSNGTSYILADIAATYSSTGDDAILLQVANGDQTTGTLTGVTLINTKVTSTTIYAGTASATPGGSSVAAKLTIDANKVTAAVPVAFPVYTAAAAAAVTGAVGWQISISNSPTVGGRMAFWDTTNSRWSYVSDNSAV